MTLKIDFDNKTVEVDSSTRLEDIVDALRELGLEWREFSVKPAERDRIVFIEKSVFPQYIQTPVCPSIPEYPTWINPVIC